MTATTYQIDHDLTEPLVFEDYSYELRHNKSLIYKPDCEFSLEPDDQLLAELDKARAALGYRPLAEYGEEDVSFDAMLIWEPDNDRVFIACLVVSEIDLPDNGKVYELLLTDKDQQDLLAELKADYAKA